MQNERLIATVNAWKGKLLDLSKRNRALNFSVNKVSTVTVINELPVEIFKLLCQQGKTLKFKSKDEPIPPNEDESPNMETLFDEIENDEAMQNTQTNYSLFSAYQTENLANNFTDDFLQTNALHENLNQLLRRLEEQARSVLEEQEINALFLALGMLHYKESNNSNEFYKAPLILVPVELLRASAREGFKVKATDDDVIVNPSLIEYLQRNYAIALPEVDYADENYNVQSFFDAVKEGVSTQTEWQITNEIYLALFSFQ